MGMATSTDGATVVGVCGNDNNAVVVSVGTNDTLGRVRLRPSELGDVSGPYATAMARHPSQRVAYALNGATYAYGGHHLAVVGVTPAGTPEVLQYVQLFSESRAIAVSPSGRWLMVGSQGVDDVRRFRIDDTGKLSDPLTLALPENPVWLGFRGP